MQKLRAAWHLLREAGARRFVFTVTTFLLLDEGRRGPNWHEAVRIDPRRHVFAPAADTPGRFASRHRLRA